MTNLTRQILSALKGKRLSMRQLFNAQTETKHEARLGILLRDLEDKSYVSRTERADKNCSMYAITPEGARALNE